MDLITVHGHGVPEHGLPTVVSFVRHTLDRGSFPRTWKCRASELDRNIESSVRNLLGMRDGATRRSDLWVLDVFESTLERVNGYPVQGLSVTPSRRTTLGERILAAYLRRDEDAILELAAAVDALEEEGG